LIGLCPSEIKRCIGPRPTLGSYDADRRSHRFPRIALIKYYPPDSEARGKIWQVMAEQFGLAIDADLIAKLVEVFPEATGRDIRGLSKLVAKYCQHKNALPTLEVFKRSSVFRGME
jgi:chromosomal replication initiation ATPase DnaA